MALGEQHPEGNILKEMAGCRVCIWAEVLLPRSGRFLPSPHTFLLPSISSFIPPPSPWLSFFLSLLSPLFSHTRRVTNYAGLVNVAVSILPSIVVFHPGFSGKVCGEEWSSHRCALVCTLLHGEDEGIQKPVLKPLRIHRESNITGSNPPSLTSGNPCTEVSHLQKKW